MAPSKVLPITRVRGRRERRREKTFVLHTTDSERLPVLRHLWRALELTGGDRAGAVWVDEYDSASVHPFAVLDLGSETPRRDFSLELVRRTWRRGVPGVVDVTGREPDLLIPPAGAGRSSFAVSLGSDGIRAWFVVVDSPGTRPALERGTVEELLFLAGECSGVLLHRDLGGDADPAVSDSRFTGWPVLRDAPSHDDVRLTDADAANRRIACRFVVLRAVRALLDEDLVMAPEEREERALAVAREIDRFSPAAPPGGESGAAVDDREVLAWRGAVEALRTDVPTALAEAVHEIGLAAEDVTHFHGAVELHRTARRVAAAVGAEEVWHGATRALGRVHRRLGLWDESEHWYRIAWDGARALGRLDHQARAMDGLASTHIQHGRLPSAREILGEAEPVARAAERPDVLGGILHTRMTVALTEGHLDEAARYGWLSVRSFAPGDPGRIRALTALGGVFLEARELVGAESAFALAAETALDGVIRLYALAGLALVAAHEGRADRFRSRLETLDRAGFASAVPALRAEVLLEVGDGFLALHDEEEARRWYGRALDVAEEFDLHEYTIRADEAVARLDRVADGDDASSPDGVEAAPEAPLLDDVELEEIRRGLVTLREGHPA